jgi:Tfp pilus assembly protein PilP
MGIIAVIIGLLVAGAPQGAAAPPSAATPPPAQPAAAQPSPQPAPAETYSYQPEGRRDPFLNLLGAGVEPRTSGRRGEGASGMTVAEISVRGVLQSRGTLVAMIAGPDNKTYIVHSGDKLLDGTIKTITPQGLVVIQEVNDPLSLVKQREVSKLLRGAEGAKE